MKDHDYCGCAPQKKCRCKINRYLLKLEQQDPQQLLSRYKNAVIVLLADETQINRLLRNTMKAAVSSRERARIERARLRRLLPLGT